MVARAVHRGGEPDDDRADAALGEGQRGERVGDPRVDGGSGTSCSVPTRPGARPSVPEAMTSAPPVPGEDRAEGVDGVPVELRRRSIWEKSWW